MTTHISKSQIVLVLVTNNTFLHKKSSAAYPVTKCYLNSVTLSVFKRDLSPI